MEFELVSFLVRKKTHSIETFGPGKRTQGVCDHIRKELIEVETTKEENEWIDVILLAFDGAVRSGISPEEITQLLDAKQTKNESRVWPDWRTIDPNKAIEHVKKDI